MGVKRKDVLVVHPLSAPRDYSGFTLRAFCFVTQIIQIGGGRRKHKTFVP